MLVAGAVAVVVFLAAAMCYVLFVAVGRCVLLVGMAVVVCVRC